MPTIPKDQRTRNRQLDGLRGLAALLVALAHCATETGGIRALRLTASTIRDASYQDIAFRLIHVPLAAEAAVVIFFVLSGHVLTRALSKRDGVGAQFVPYVWRRAWRLLPVSIAAAVPLVILSPADMAQIVGAAFLYDYTANGVIWSLRVEVFGSLLVFLLWGMRGFSRLLPLATLAACAVAAANTSSFIVMFLPAFVLGALISDCPDGLFRHRLILVAAVIVMLAAEFFSGLGLVLLATRMICAFLIVGHLAHRDLAFLTTAPMQFLGAVSYPFYLLHKAGSLAALWLFEVAGLTLAALNPFLAAALYAATSIPIALGLAFVVHRYVELPGIACGEESQLRLFWRTLRSKPAS